MALASSRRPSANDGAAGEEATRTVGDFQGLEPSAPQVVEPEVDLNLAHHHPRHRRVLEAVQRSCGRPSATARTASAAGRARRVPGTARCCRPRPRHPGVRRRGSRSGERARPRPSRAEGLHGTTLLRRPGGGLNAQRTTAACSAATRPCRVSAMHEAIERSQAAALDELGAGRRRHRAGPAHPPATPSSAIPCPAAPGRGHAR